MFSASPISLTVTYTPASSCLCHRHARASALTSVPSGCRFEVGTISLPSGATMRFRPPRHPQTHWDPHDERGTVEPCLGALNHAAILSPCCRYLASQACQALDPYPHLDRFLLHVDPLNEQLDDARLLGGEQLSPDRGEVGEQERHLAPGDLVRLSRFAPAQVRATSSGAARSFWM
jgi:hypothetical protein